MRTSVRECDAGIDEDVPVCGPSCGCRFEDMVVDEVHPKAAVTALSLKHVHGVPVAFLGVNHFCTKIIK